MVELPIITTDVGLAPATRVPQHSRAEGGIRLAMCSRVTCASAALSACCMHAQLAPSQGAIIRPLVSGTIPSGAAADSVPPPTSCHDRERAVPCAADSGLLLSFRARSYCNNSIQLNRYLPSESPSPTVRVLLHKHAAAAASARVCGGGGGGGGVEGHAWVEGDFCKCAAEPRRVNDKLNARGGCVASATGAGAQWTGKTSRLRVPLSF